MAAAMPQPSAIIQETRTPTSLARDGIVRRRAHGQADPREAEEEEQREQQDQRDGHHARLVGA